MSQKTAWFLPQGQRGGWDTIRARDGTLLYSPIYLIPVDLSPGNRPSPCRTAEIWEDDSDPPQKRGGMRSRVAALWDRPLHRPQGVAIVGIYPCGKARKRRPGAARIKRRMALWNCGRTGGN